MRLCKLVEQHLRLRRGDLPPYGIPESERELREQHHRPMPIHVEVVPQVDPQPLPAMLRDCLGQFECRDLVFRGVFVELDPSCDAVVSDY